MPPYIYAILPALIAVISIAFSSWVLHRLELSDPTQPSSSWWKAWQRAGLLTVGAFATGLIGALLPAFEQHLAASLLWAFSCFVLPFIYKEYAVGLKNYRIEQLAAWAAWLSATIVLGGSPIYYPFFALTLWLVCAVVGGRVMRFVLRMS